MSNLVVDVGNTSTALKFGGEVFHVDGGIDAALEVAAQAIEKAAAVHYVSVVPDADEKWRRFAEKNGKTFLQVAFPCGLALKYDYPAPETIGADRLCDAEAAFAKYGAPVLVMDFGTALTAAVVTSDKTWQGGVIAPGFPLMRDYLFERTAKLPRMEIGRGDAPKIGKSTEEAMRFGAIVGYRGMVKEIVSELKRNFTEDFRLVATGGFAHWALKGSGMDFTIDETLTLEGCELICSRMQ